MTEIFNSLDAREFATILWIGIFIVWCITKSKIRKALGSVILTATARPLAIAFGIAIAYLAATTVVLHTLDLWTLQQFKVTVFWFIVAGIPAFMDVQKISRDPSMLRAIAAKNFKLSLLLDFLINLFKLPLLAELIFVPFTALVGALLAVAQSNEKYAPVQKFLNGVLITMGFGILAFEIYKVSTSFDTIANAHTLRDFALPIIYNITCIPLLWAMSIYMAYESVFSRLRLIINDSALHSYAKRRLVLEFRTDIFALNIWFKAAWSGTFISRDDIIQSITAIDRPRNAA